MRIERQDGAKQILLRCAFHHPPQYLLVPTMHAVEVADGHHDRLALCASARDPFLRRMQHRKRHQISTSSFRPSYDRRTLGGSFAFVAACPRSWQMCVNHARLGFSSSTSASDCSTLECIGCGT